MAIESVRISLRPGMLTCTTMVENKCATCSELRVAAIAAVESSHEAFLLVLDAINTENNAKIDDLMRAAAEQGNAKLGVIDAYMKHLRTHCDDCDEGDEAGQLPAAV
jgi:hypothetical protein